MAMAFSPYEPEFRIGDVIQCDLGQFIVDRILAAGGMGIVYQVSRAGQNAPLQYAIKTIRRELLARQDVLARFEAEAAILARIDHENIVRVHGISWTTAGPRVPLILMDLLKGSTLRDALSLPDAIPMFDVCTVAIGVLRALQEIHPNIVHRDIKPENIFLRRVRTETRAVLVDFGLVKQPFAAMAQTVGNTFLGSYAYASPEQLQGFPVTPQSDLYSLGAVLYELLTRTPLFPGLTDAGALGIAQIRTEPRPLHEFTPRIPTALADVVMQALQKNPNARPTDARAFAAPFERLLSRLPAESAASSTFARMLDQRTVETGPRARSSAPPGMEFTLPILPGPSNPDLAKTEVSAPPTGAQESGPSNALVDLDELPPVSNFKRVLFLSPRGERPSAPPRASDRPPARPTPVPPAVDVTLALPQHPSPAPGARMPPAPMTARSSPPVVATPAKAASNAATTVFADPQAPAETPFAKFAAARPVAPLPFKRPSARAMDVQEPDALSESAFEPPPASAFAQQRRVVLILAIASAVGAIVAAIILLAHLARRPPSKTGPPASVARAQASSTSPAPLPRPLVEPAEVPLPSALPSAPPAPGGRR